MNRIITILALILVFSAGLLAQPGGGTTSFSYGGTSSTGYSQSSGTNSVSGQTYTSTGSDENAVQVTGGTLTMTNCTITKSGDTSTSGDETSFYGINSSVFAGNESTSTSATITMTGGTITSNAQGANAIFAYGGGNITVSGVTIDNTARASRGLIATGGGTITGYNLDITTRDETSSVIATDRGGGTVSVDGGSYVAYGNKCAIIYSAGTMSASNATGSSASGEIGVIEGDNSITINNCTFSSGSSERGLLMMQSGSGDATGTNPEMTITNSTLTMTDNDAPLIEVATLVTATCTLDGCSLTVPSGILMYVMEDDQWTTSGAVGNLILSNGTYSGQVKYDSGYTANVTVNSGATWNLTANTSVCAIVNNGTIVTNGYTLTYTSMAGSGSIVESGSTTSYYTVTATANPTAGGTVSGAGTYTENTTCTLVATANSGYTFTNWTLNDEVVSTSASYSFTVSADAAYVANFEEETPTTLDDNCVTVVYNGTTATVTVADNIASYLTVTQSGAHVSIAQSDDVASEITYTLSGSSTDGEFYMSGSYKATIELNGLTLTNATPVYSGAAVHIQNGKRINVKVITGTTNTLEDATSGSQKGCLYVKGHAEFKQSGTLNVVGNVKHGIKAGEYITIKNATINVTSAVGDGISCNEYFLMQSGTVNISGTGDDGIQADLDGTTSTGMTTDHEDEDSGNVYISGGTITITCPAVAAKGIKSAGDMYISGSPVITVTTSGDGEWDEDDLETKAACGISSDGNIDISGGTLILTATGSGGKGMKCDNLMTISGGDITVVTSGGLYYNNGTTENTNYTGDTDNVDSDYYSSPKGIKAGTKTEVSTDTYTYAGGLIISGGTISVTTSGHNAEGIESKNTFDISGGEIYVNAYDDALNSAQDLTITGGYVYARATNNDGMDANGDMYIQDGLVYAIGASSPEVAIDVNSEDSKKLYFSGGTLIAIGGLESGSVLNQTCYQVSSVSSNTWYSMTYGSNAIAFLTPTISSGGGPNSKDGPGGGGPGGGGPGGGGDPGGGGNSSTMVISASSTPTLKSGVTVSGGTSIFDGNCYVDATFSGGSTVSTSQYSSGGSGTGSPSYRFNIAGNWNTASNWSTGTVPGSSATVTINADCQLDTDAEVTDLTVTTSKVLTIGSGQTLTVSGDLTNTLTSGLVIEDGAQLVNASEGVQATAQKTIEAYTGDDDNYYLIASPMTESLEAGNVTDLLSNDYDLYLYDQSETLEWRNYKASEFTTIDNTKGYLYANSSAVTLNFAGTLHPSGTETVDVEYDGSADIPGWNLIGNPFACNAYLGSSQAFYKMGTDGTALEAVDAGTAISPLEGVFVETTVSGSVTFSTTATRGAGSLNVRVLEANGKELDNAIVSFGNGGMLGKFMLKENATKVYLPQNGKDYAVVCSDGQGEMTVSFKAVKNGNYTLSINAKDIDMDYLHLIDNITGNDIDLLAAGASTSSATYTFEAKTTDYASRFRLVFNANESADEAFAFFNGSEWVVSNPSTGSGTATLQVIDMMGRIVSDMNVSGSTHISLNVNPGLYVMRLIDGGNTKTQKIIIN